MLRLQDHAAGSCCTDMRVLCRCWSRCLAFTWSAALCTVQTSALRCTALAAVHTGLQRSLGWPLLCTMIARRTGMSWLHQLSCSLAWCNCNGMGVSRAAGPFFKGSLGSSHNQMQEHASLEPVVESYMQRMHASLSNNDPPDKSAAASYNHARNIPGVPSTSESAMIVRNSRVKQWQCWTGADAQIAH